MPDDENRVDLNDLTGDLLKDIESATSAVKQEADKQKARDARSASLAKSKRMYILVAVIAALVLAVVAFVLVGRGPEQQTPGNTGQGSMGTNNVPPPSNYTLPGVVPTRPQPRPAIPQPIRPQPSEDYGDSTSEGVSDSM